MEERALRQVRYSQVAAPFTFESAHQPVPALPEPLSDAEMSRIAKDNRAERLGLASVTGT
jgi:hypothetical protein